MSGHNDVQIIPVLLTGIILWIYSLLTIDSIPAQG